MIKNMFIAILYRISSNIKIPSVLSIDIHLIIHTKMNYLLDEAMKQSMAD